MEKRRLGKTGHMSTVVTFGTFAIGSLSQEEADRVIEEALARGINHFDIAPTYGEAELRLGSYLKRHPQPSLFIGCKTLERSRDGAWDQLRRTLDRLGRDRHDLYQLHAVCTVADLEACFAPDGAMEAVLQAQEEGIVMHVGVTGHGLASPATHVAALRRFDFATVMTSCNLFLASQPDFRRGWEALLALCQAQDVGIHVLKATARRPWGDRAPTYRTWYEPLTDQRDVERAVAWALQQPVTTLCSAGDGRLLASICDAAERYREISEAEQLRLLELADFSDIFAAA